MRSFLIISCVFVHCISLTSACSDHPVNYVISHFGNDGEFVLTEMKQNVIVTPFDKTYSIKLTESIKTLCKGMLNITHETRYFYISEGLEEIEPGAFENQRFMDAFFFNLNRIRVLKSGTFANLLKLNEIDLTDNEIEIIEEGALENLPNLRILNLSKNKLTAINPNSFKATPKLVTLNLNFNLLYKLHPNIFSFLSEDLPVDLRIAGNRLDDIHFKTFDELNLIKLNVTDNRLKLLPENVVKNEDMELLDVSNNQLTRLPEGVYSLKKLKALRVDGNPLDCYTQNKLRNLARNLGVNIVFRSSC